MFESVAPEKFTPRSRKIFYESLPASIAAHVAAAALIVVGGTWQVTFPNESPRMMTMYTLSLPPSPPPPPPGAPPPKAAVTTPKPPQPKPAVKEEIVAPTIIPDEIPVVLAPEEARPVVDAPIPTEIAGAIGGVEGGLGSGDGGSGNGSGSKGGIEGGMPEGVEGGIPPDTVFIKRHQPLPMSMTPVSMVYPFYPEEARQRGWEDAVTVRYVIGKDGRVKTVTVLEAPQRPVFEKTVVKAISHWRFRPLIKNGVKHEVIHELVVNFRLTGGSWQGNG